MDIDAVTILKFQNDQPSTLACYGDGARMVHDTDSYGLVQRARITHVQGFLNIKQ